MIKLLAPTALIIGLFLRLIWLEDMEYKYDEIYMFEKTQAIGLTEPWPALGMASGVGTQNPPMSIWAFVVLKKITGALTPLELSLAVRWLNIFALFGVLWLIWTRVEKQKRDLWLWGLSLACVSPFAIVIHRKIWAQSLLPFFSVLFWLAWWKRNTARGAFFYGFIGALLGQLHMSGFFFAAAIWIWTVLAELLRKAKTKTRWIYWLMGSATGAIFLVPWLKYMEKGTPLYVGIKLKNLFRWDYWYNLLTNSMGTMLDYSLGPHFEEFMSHPLIKISHWGVWGLTALAIGFWLWRVACKEIKLSLFPADPTPLIISAVLIPVGLLLSLKGFKIYRHYEIVQFPLEWVILASLFFALPKKFKTPALVMMWIFQFTLSWGFIKYIRDHGGAPDGDYGTVYRLKQLDPHNAPR